MNLLELQRKLIAAARAHQPSDHVPYAFEQRIMARLTRRPAQDPWGFWGRALARSAVMCVVIMLIMTGIVLYQPAPSQETLLSQDVEQTLFAAVDSPSVDQVGEAQ